MSWRLGNSIDKWKDEAQAAKPGCTIDTIGDAAHSSRESDHNPCDCHNAVCASDIYVRDFDCNQIAENLRQMAIQGDGRIKYVIFNRRIFSGPNQSYPAGQWRNYTGSNPHTDHLHISVAHPSQYFDSTAAWDVFGGPPTPVESIGVESVAFFVSLSSGQTLLVNEGIISIGSETDRQELVKAIKDIDHVAKVGEGTSNQFLAALNKG
jgi:hypothetical protein